MKKNEIKNKRITCADCRFSQFIPTGKKGDPAIIFCAVLDKRLVVRAARKCWSYQQSPSL